MLTLGMDGVGQSADSFIPFAAISDDGRRVAFAVLGDQMVVGDTNGARDIFVRDLEKGTVQLVSHRLGGAGSGNAGSTAPNISADGRYVVFASEASDLVPGDTNGEWDLFRFEVESGQIDVVTADRSGLARGGFIPAPQFGPFGAPMDAAGRRVAFISAASLTPEDQDDGLLDLYVRDLESGRIFWISTEDIAPSDAFFMRPELDHNGRRIYFIVPLDGEPAMQLFVQDLETGHRRLLSRRGGEPADLGVSHLALTETELFFMSASSHFADGDDDEHLDLFALPLAPSR